LRPAQPWKRALPATLAVTAPAFLVLIGLALSGRIDLWIVLFLVPAVILMTGLMVHQHLGNMDRLIEQANRLESDPETPPPAVDPGDPASEAVEALARLGRKLSTWRRESKEQIDALESLIEALPDPLLLLNDQRRIVRANPAARSYFGRDLKGHDLAVALRDPAVLEAFESSRAKRSVRTAREVAVDLAEPLERSLKVAVVPLPGQGIDGAIALVALHDVTALKRIEQMRADFVANASHELRTPLATLSGFIETLQGPAKGDGEAQEKFLAIMGEQAGRMTRLVADLLSLSRVELNEHTPPTGPVDLRRMLNSVADALTPQAKAKSMRISLVLPEAPLNVTGQPDEVTQVFQNLMDNAIKYGREGSEVEARVMTVERGPMTMGPEARLDCLAVAVRDQGEGIAKEHLPRLTERFYRVDTARSRQMGGTGLGLAIVKHIVNRHRGALVIDSQAGEGSVFTVYLPRYRGEG
jgi:two-component system phosphate regulon sensor histidine kinase PhoR